MLLLESKFDTAQDFDGWNCGKITTCGDMGQICGGFNVKGKGSEIKKTFDLPAGTYSVNLDFIKIDSWFVCEMWCAFGMPLAIFGLNIRQNFDVIKRHRKNMSLGW